MCIRLCTVGLSSVHAIIERKTQRRGERGSFAALLELGMCLLFGARPSGLVRPVPDRLAFVFCFRWTLTRPRLHLCGNADHQEEPMRCDCQRERYFFK